MTGMAVSRIPTDSRQRRHERGAARHGDSEADRPRRLPRVARLRSQRLRDRLLHQLKPSRLCLCSGPMPPDPSFAFLQGLRSLPGRCGRCRAWPGAWPSRPYPILVPQTQIDKVRPRPAASQTPTATAPPSGPGRGVMADARYRTGCGPLQQGLRFLRRRTIAVNRHAYASQRRKTAPRKAPPATAEWLRARAAKDAGMGRTRRVPSRGSARARGPGSRARTRPPPPAGAAKPAAAAAAAAAASAAIAAHHVSSADVTSDSPSCPPSSGFRSFLACLHPVRARRGPLRWGRGMPRGCRRRRRPRGRRPPRRGRSAPPRRAPPPAGAAAPAETGGAPPAPQGAQARTQPPPASRYDAKSGLCGTSPDCQTKGCV